MKYSDQFQRPDIRICKSEGTICNSSGKKALKMVTKPVRSINKELLFHNLMIK